MTSEEIVKALWCISTPGDHTSNCEQCPYWKKEQLNGRIKEKLGTDTWTSCDVDKVGMDAADLIERLTAENVVLPYGEVSAIESLRKEIEWKDMVIALAQRKQAEAEAERDALREKVPRWISVDDRHPKPGTRVLATDGVFVGEAYRTSADTWHRYDGIAMRDCIGSVVTNWMPLPEAPEEGEKE